MTASLKLSLGPLVITITGGPAGDRDWVGLFDADGDS